MSVESPRLLFGAIESTVFEVSVAASIGFAMSCSSKLMFLSSSRMRLRYSSVVVVVRVMGVVTAVVAAVAAAAITRLRLRSSSARLIYTSFSRCARRSVSIRSRSCAYAASMSS